MAAPSPDSSSPSPALSDRSRPLATPQGIVVGSLLLWIVGVVAAAAANVAGAALRIEDPAMLTAARYLLYVPATLLFLLALVALIIGAARWAIYGKETTGPGSVSGGATDAELLRSINDRLLLSDTAKRIAYRQHDLAALRRAIREDIDKGEFDAAMVLVQEMSHTFGYREESEAIREQIMAARAADLEQKIKASMEELSQLIAGHKFGAAGLMAAKMARLYPENERTNKVIDYVEEMKEQYKLRVQRDMEEARNRGEAERAWQLLQELDGYLTPKEAEELADVARDVIARMRDNLGVQFKMAVENQEWSRALAVGEQIIRDFPNTRMADEARGMLDQLKQRAREQRASA